MPCKPLLSHSEKEVEKVHRREEEEMRRRKEGGGRGKVRREKGDGRMIRRGVEYEEDP